MADTFDWRKLLDERKLVQEEVKEEFNDSGSVRSEGLLMTNWVDNLLKDCIVILTKSEKSRKIPRGVILKILLDREFISKELGQDIERINQIRDLFGHTMRKSVIEEKISPIVESMNQTKTLKDQFPDWEKWNSHERLTMFSIHIVGILNKVFFDIKIPAN